MDFKEGEEVLARWTDCRYYPAKIETINKEGTYTVQFYDGVIRCLKKMHIKSMPEDAKGQDWIALVKAAAAVTAKNKSTSKPRTSVNSSKDKEERKGHKTAVKREETPASKPQDLLLEEEEPTSSRNLEIAMEEVPKPPPQNQEDDLVLKRKLTQTSSFQAKRARLNQITGLLASKAVGLDNSEKKPQVTEKPLRPEEESSPKPQTQKQADMCHSGITVTPTQLSPPRSSRKACSKKEKQESGNFSGSKKSPMSKNDSQLKQGIPYNAKYSKSGRNNQRRSRRMTTASSIDPTCQHFKDGIDLSSIIQTPQDLSKTIVPDVAFVPQEKLEPLDLSRNKEMASVVGLGSAIGIDCPSKEKEHVQLLNYSSKALADGRIASTSSAPDASGLPLPSDMAVPNNVKTAKNSRKKKSPVVPNMERTEKPIPAMGEKPSEKLPDRTIKMVKEEEKQAEAGVKAEKKVKIAEKSAEKILLPSSGKKKDKDKDRKEKKEKDPSKLKQKKKKKKKKKSKQHDNADCDVSSLDLPELSLPPVTLNNTPAIKNISFQYPRAILSVDLTGENLSDVEFLEDSSTESLILSGDEYNQEFDSTNFDESQDEEDAINEIVRCVCQLDEENGFMIQCEECLCWQHSVCMGLLEDSIPDQYICYVCSDPPGQRWSSKYRYDKDWYNSGHMCGMSFINDNYSYLNAKKIVSTHHLLADVYGVTEILRGLQLKFGILKDKNHPDLRFWACPIKPWDSAQVNNKRLAVSSPSERGARGQNHKASANSLDTTDETYITSEHSYQKPQGSDHEGKPSRETGKPAQRADMLSEGQKPNCRGEGKKMLLDEKRNDQVIMEEACTDRRAAEEQLDSHLQRQLNLLSHIESVQNEVTSRMDLIEKEVDVLESWLDFTGDLEPPDPIARLPQLKRRIRQLLTDMGKAQQIATLCTV